LASVSITIVVRMSANCFSARCALRTAAWAASIAPDSSSRGACIWWLRQYSSAVATAAAEAISPPLWPPSPSLSTKHARSPSTAMPTESSLLGREPGWV
jgi:hypothetical protein